MIKLENSQIIKDTSVSPEGWYHPVNITYGIQRVSGDNQLLWRVANTNQTFRLPLKYVTKDHGGDYEAHFELTLVKFREDLLEWIGLGLPEEWMKDYYRQFNLLIKY